MNEIPLLTKQDGWPNGPRRIVLFGPPGTGKTQAVLNHWALPALASGADPSRVLLCSFTRAAAGELRERLAKDAGISVRALRETCSTVHAEALRRVRASRGTVKVWEGSKTKEQDDDDDAGPDLSREDRSLRDAAASAVSFCRNTLTYPDGLEVAAAKAAGSMRSSCGLDDILREIERYEQEKRDAGAMDFTDLLEHAALAETRPLDLLILDEAQDSTPLIWSVFEWWARSTKTVVVVGDPDQAIYQWSGADSRRFVDLMGEGWEARRLGVSWRVPAIQHALARSIILRNTSRIDAPYDPKDHAGAVIKVREDGGAEALAMKTEGRVLMLARTSAMLTRWATTLAEAGVPFINERGWSPFTPGGPLNACLAVLQLRLRGRTNAGLARALVRELPARGKQWLTNGRKQTLALIAGDEDTGYDAAAIISLGVNVSKLLELSAQDALGVLMCIARLDDYSSRRRINAILAAWSRGQDDALVDRPRITLTTMHASKGREAPLVIVSPQMASPAITARNEGKADEVEAERRVLYVAVTRSSETLVIDAAAPGEHYSELYHEGSLAPVVVTSDEVPF